MDLLKEQEKRMKNIIIDFDNDNRNCADCGKERMDYASINNGTIICAECAEVHKQFGPSISYLRTFSEKWDDYLLNYIRVGGNSRFSDFEKGFGVADLDIQKKYKTRAAIFYRDMLRSEVMGFDPPENINLETAAEVVDQIENQYPEFENYTFVKHVDLDTLEQNIQKKKSVFDSVRGWFGSFTQKLDNTADLIANRVAELQVTDTLFEHGNKALFAVKDVAENAKGKFMGVAEDAKGKIKGFYQEFVGEEKNNETTQEKVQVDINDDDDNDLPFNPSEIKINTGNNTQSSKNENNKETNITNQSSSKENPPAEQNQTKEEPKQEEEKKEETKQEEVKQEETKKEEAKKEETKKEEVKQEEVKQEETKQEEIKPEETKQEEIKPEEIKPEETKQEEPKQEEKQEAKQEKVDNEEEEKK